MPTKKIKVYIKENSTVAKIAAMRLGVDDVAIVFGRTIYLCNKTKKEFLSNKEWVLHELKHVSQYQEYGFVGFVVLYLMEYFKNGYYHNKFEKEARSTEQDSSLLERYEII